VLDSVQKTLNVYPIPLIESVSRTFGSFTGEIELPLSRYSYADTGASSVDITVSDGFLFALAPIVKNLISYPYGCIEQTVSSTLPNAYALKYAELFGDENLSVS
jgi:uncharacterized protein YfaS (alpha-2-macroglobulin family)